MVEREGENLGAARTSSVLDLSGSFFLRTGGVRAERTDFVVEALGLDADVLGMKRSSLDASGILIWGRFCVFNRGQMMRRKREIGGIWIG